MTEHEAKMKWCPMVRAGEGSTTRNRSDRDGRISKEPGFGIVWNCCIASNCMMWRQEALFGAGRIAEEERSKTRGYCGLAGKDCC